MRKILSIIYYTYVDITNNPAVFIVTLLAIIFILLCPSLSFFYFTDEDKITATKEIITSTISLVFLFVAIISISHNLEQEKQYGSLALVLSKPISRRQFLFGKFLGFLFAMLAISLLLLIVFFLSLWLSQGVDTLNQLAYKQLTARHKLMFLNETGKFIGSTLLPLLYPVVFTLYQAIVIGFILTFIGIHLNMIMNSLLGLFILVLGNCYEYIHQWIVNNNVWIGFKYLSKIFYNVIPNFSNLNGVSMITLIDKIDFNYFVLVSCCVLCYCFLFYLFYILFLERLELT